MKSPMKLKCYFRYVAYAIVGVWISVANAGTTEDFFKAVELDNERWVQQLLAQGAEPNSRNTRGQPALHLALQSGALKVAATLAAHPALQVDATNTADETALMMACLHGHSSIAQQLLARGASVNRPGWTPLHYAASGPEPQLVARLLERGAAIDSLSPNRTTPLMMAARYGNPDAATLLLARGADARLRNERGLTAADFATGAGREALAQRLQAASPQ
jgi:uncharacterized protein